MSMSSSSSLPVALLPPARLWRFEGPGPSLPSSSEPLLPDQWVACACMRRMPQETVRADRTCVHVQEATRGNESGAGRAVAGLRV